MTIRTRIAPSPTGDPHVGTAYVALFNYCFARKHQGQFVLRIEDTDLGRSSRASEAVILRSLRWLGLSWDEGPETGGPFGPYRQSERGEIYRVYADQLLRDGHAFRCFCTTERLADMRAAQRASGLPPRYDGLCLSLTAAESQSRAQSGLSHVVRLKVPTEGTCFVKDLIRGEIAIGWDTVDMQVLLKPDGMPTYHLANVVDDHLMEITHVIRGEEWVSSAPKHALLYQYLGWQMPLLCHLPLLRNPDKSKLSKRNNPTSLLFYERMGFLPEALLNYLGLMAWSMPNGEEKFSLDEMIEQFTLDRISLGGPVFDFDKLQWLNGRYIREQLTHETFIDRVQLWAANRDYFAQLVPLVQSRIAVLSDLGPLLQPFFSGMLDIKPEVLLKGRLTTEEVIQAFQLALARFDTLEWSRSEIESAFRSIATQMNFKIRDLLRPFFVAITGSTTSVPLFDGMAILGRDLCRARIRHALSVATNPAIRVHMAPDSR